MPLCKVISLVACCLNRSMVEMESRHRMWSHPYVHQLRATKLTSFLSNNRLSFTGPRSFHNSNLGATYLPIDRSMRWLDRWLDTLLLFIQSPMKPIEDPCKNSYQCAHQSSVSVMKSSQSRLIRCNTYNNDIRSVEIQECG
jgi:hypothetical protein